jgi:aspartate 1-decarboxylase
MRLIQLLKAKVHHARVTYANPDYVGSIEMCPDVMERVGLHNGEFVNIWDVDNAERFSTYCFAGEKGTFGVNGAAAHKVRVGDRLIIAAFTWTDEEVIPKIVLLDENNAIVRDMVPYDRNG